MICKISQNETLILNLRLSAFFVPRKNNSPFDLIMKINKAVMIREIRLFNCNDKKYEFSKSIL